MDETKRGSIQNRDRLKQLIDFSGLKYQRKITPTDIDGFIDFGDEAFIFYEIKYQDTPIHMGQKLAYQRLCDAVIATHRTAIVFIGRHDIHDVQIDIDVSNVKISEYYYDKKWVVTDCKNILSKCIEGFLEKQHLNKYINSKQKYCSSCGILIKDEMEYCELCEIVNKTGIW